jgi:uncharacterized protein with HEPN domain
VRRDGQRLRDILESIERIERFATRGRAAFDSEELVQVWVVHYLQIIGEAARALSEPIRAKYHQVPWSVIVGMRHILVHDYSASISTRSGLSWSGICRDCAIRSRASSARKNPSASRDEFSAISGSNDNAFGYGTWRRGAW